jgi:hypothetical protein
MTQTIEHNDEPVRHDLEIRETIVKSTFCGVAATVLAITIASPAGVGGIIGTSVAEGFGLAPDTAHDVVSFPQVPAPLSETELTDIRERLSASITAIDDMRAITDDEIDHLRQLAAIEEDAVLTAESPRQQDVELANLLLRDTQS